MLGKVCPGTVEYRQGRRSRQDDDEHLLVESNEAVCRSAGGARGLWHGQHYLRVVIRDLQQSKIPKSALGAQMLEGARSRSVRMTKNRWERLDQ
jgi:hypothetical protein